jgi:hypothetical protein
MKQLSLDEQRELVRMRRRGEEESARLRRERLRGMPYNWEHVVALLDLGLLAKLPSRSSSGLVEMHMRLWKAYGRSIDD